MAERKGAAYRITSSRPAGSHGEHTQTTQASKWAQRQGWKNMSSSGSVYVTQPQMGRLTAHADYNMEGPVGIEMGAWEGPLGHTAEVRHYQYESQGFGRRPEIEETNYTAGPFRTKLRAQIAAGGLAGRVHAGRAEEYEGR